MKNLYRDRVVRLFEQSGSERLARLALRLKQGHEMTLREYRDLRGAEGELLIVWGDSDMQDALIEYLISVYDETAHMVKRHAILFHSPKVGELVHVFFSNEDHDVAGARERRFVFVENRDGSFYWYDEKTFSMRRVHRDDEWESIS